MLLRLAGVQRAALGAGGAGRAGVAAQVQATACAHRALGLGGGGKQEGEGEYETFHGFLLCDWVAGSDVRHPAVDRNPA